MKRADYLKLTPEQIELIGTGETDSLEETGFTDEQWGLLTMLLGSFQGDMNMSFHEWIHEEME